MSILQIELSDQERETLESLSRDTGKSPQTIAKEALNEVLRESQGFDWKSAIMQAAGMWKDHNNLPNFEQIRRSMDRNVWSR